MKTLIGLLLSLAIAPVPQVIAQSATTAARDRVTEDFSRFAGVWEAEPPFRQAEGPRPRFVSVLEITTTPTEIRLNRGYAPIETYRLDGSVTTLDEKQFPGSREIVTGSASILDDTSIALTGRYSRHYGEQGIISTIYADVYRVAGDVLTLESRRSQAQEDGSLVQMQNHRVSIVYRRRR